MSSNARSVDTSVLTASTHAIVAARKFNEIFVGGDGTSCMIQLIAASESPQDQDSQLDVIASVLLPLEEVRIAYTARAQEAFQLLCSFWTWSPESPALLSHGGAYHRLLCMADDCRWTEGYLCPAHLKVLQSSGDRRLDDSGMHLRIYVPGEPGDSTLHTEARRAAINRSAVEDEESAHFI